MVDCSAVERNRISRRCATAMPLTDSPAKLLGCAGLALTFAVLGGCISGKHEVLESGAGADVRVVAGSARKICQLTGDTDNSLATAVPVRSRTTQRAHLLGTDLGVGFTGPAPATVTFLFGDSVPLSRNRHADSDDAIASVRADADPEKCLDLDFYTDPNGEYVPIELAGFKLGSFDVPTSAFVADGATFATFAVEATGTPRRPTRSVLGVADHFPDPPRFVYIADLPAGKMTNVSAVLVDEDWRPGPKPTRALFFGTGRYRSGRNVFLAAFPLETLRTGARTWFAGRASARDARWSASENDAHPLFNHDGSPCMGELSVTWNRYLDRWLMLYNCIRPRGVLFRVAPEPWGPWSEPRVLFDPRADQGYCVFIHDARPRSHCPPGSPNPRDSLISRGHGGADAYGGEYGPYVIDAFTRGDGNGRTTIYFTLSTWNPYQVVLMKARLERGQVDD